jgi:hypothetical protein
MPIFRKKPVVIQAEQWWSTKSETRGVKYRSEYTKEDPEYGEILVREGAYVETIHDGQTVDLEPGDWVLPEPDGIHFYPCKPDIFDATYEPVEDLQSSPESVWRPKLQPVEPWPIPDRGQRKSFR